LLAAGAVVLVVAAAAPALAQQDDEALLRQGVELRRAGKDEQALELFQQAFRLRPTPRAQAQAGFAEQALGRWLDAERDITRALASSGDPWVAKNAATLRQSLAVVAQHLGNLQILGSPPGATVKVDDRPVGTLPMEAPARVTAGEVLVAVSAPGHVQIQRKLTVGAGAMVRDTFTLPVAQNEAQVSSGGASNGDLATKLPPEKSSAGGHAAVETVTAPGAGARPDAGGGGLSTTQGWAIGVASAGVVAVGIGAVFGAQAISKNNDSKSGCDGNVCDAAGKQARLDAISAGNKATVAMVIGGALVATGTVLFLVGRGQGAASERTAVRIAPAVTPEGWAVVGALSF
jgi:hypothetical protein